MKNYLLGCLLLLIFCSTAEAKVPMADHKLLLFQQQFPEASYIGAHPAEVNALPFEGVLFSLPSMDAMRSGASISVDQFKAELAPMKAVQAQLNKVRHNFVHVRLVKTGPFNTQTPIVASNFANLAEAARDAGLEGISFDNEDYENDTWDPSVTCPGQTVDQCQAQAVQAGKTVMQAMIAKWPTIKLITMLGPFFGDATTFTQILHEAPELKHLVLGAYTFGFNEATLGTQATYIDGGEVFSIHTADVAQADYNLRKVVLPQDSILVPAAIKDAWAQKISLGFSFYDEQGGTPDRWQNDLTVNMNASDEYTWAFSFNHVWIGQPGAGKSLATQDWINATTAGRVAAGMNAFPLPGGSVTGEPSGSPVPNACNLMGDANHDGKISLADYSVWRSAFIAK